MQLGLGVNLVSAGAPGTPRLIILGSQATDHTTGSSFSPSVTAPEGTDAIAVMWISRANGGGNTYSAALTIGGVSSTRLNGNSNLATTDNHGMTDIFFARGTFSGSVTLALVPGASVRPGRMHAVFLSGSQAGTALGAATLVKQTTSGTALTGDITPTALTGVVLIIRGIFASGSPTFASYSPAGHMDLGDTALSTAATLSRVGANAFYPAALSAVTVDTPAAIAATQRNLGLWELVR